MKKSKKEIRDWVLENCVDKNGDLDLTALDKEGKKMSRVNELYQISENLLVLNTLNLLN